MPVPGMGRMEAIHGFAMTLPIARKPHRLQLSSALPEALRPTLARARVSPGGAEQPSSPLQRPTAEVMEAMLPAAAAQVEEVLRDRAASGERVALTVATRQVVVVARAEQALP